MKMKSNIALPAITLVAVLLLPAAAQMRQPGGGPGMEQKDGGMRPELAQEFRELMAESFFPPEVIMKQARALKLTEEQQKIIKEEMQKAQSAFVDLQWQVTTETDILSDLLRDTKPDEAKVLSQAEKVMNIENSIKKTHLGMLLRIKNALTPEQQEQLRSVQRRARGPGGQEGRAPFPPPGPQNAGFEREQAAPPRGERVR